MRQGKVFLGSEAGPGTFDDVGPKEAGNLDGTIGGAGINNDDLIGPADAFEGAAKVLLLVTGYEGDREQRHGRHKLRKDA